MLFHLTAKIVGRSKGMDATAAAAYITRSRIEDRTTGETFDHTHHKDKAIFTERYLPDDHPDFAEVKLDKNGNPDYGELWNLVEENEKRKDAQFARNFNLALQDEFTDEENKECLEKFISENFTSRGIIVDAAGHEPHIEEDGTNNSNKHAHFLATIRQVDKNGWKAKKDREANTKDFLNKLRKSWADINNAMFDRKFISAHKEEYEELEKELRDILPDEEERKRETVQLLYDKFPLEWIYISEKTLDEQREEVEQWLEEEEEKEYLNMERIARLEKKFLSIPFEAQRHLGPKAKAMQRKGKDTDRKAYDKDPRIKNREVEAELDAVTVSDEELEKELQKDPIYESLEEAKKAVLKQTSESIQDSDEVRMIREQVDAIKSTEEMTEWLRTVWKPIKTRIELSAQRNAAFDDIMSENSVIKDTYEAAKSEETDLKKQMTVSERVKSLEKFSETEKGRAFTDSENQEEEISETLKEMNLFAMIRKKFSETVSFVKEKSQKIIENSPLRKFKIFRAQREIVEANKYYRQQSEVIENERPGSIGNKGSAGEPVKKDRGVIDFNAGFEEYSSRIDSERAEQAAQGHEGRTRQANRREQERTECGQETARKAPGRSESRIQDAGGELSEQHGRTTKNPKKGNGKIRGR